MNRILDLFNEFNLEGKSISEEHKDDNVLIIDGTNTFMRCFAANTSQNDSGEHVGGVIGFLFSIGVAIRINQPTRVIIVFDGKGGSKKRKDIYSGYKQGRAFKSKLRRTDGFDDLEDESASLKRQFSRLINYLDVLPVSIIKMDYVEADDVISYMSNKLFSNKVTIVSSDKDFLQLINDKVSVFSPIRKKTYNPTLFKEEFNISSENYIFMKCILGDKSDGVPGIPGIGPKTIDKKLGFLKGEETFTIDTFISKIKTLNETVDSTYTKLLKCEEELRRNYTLMQLHEIDISGDKKTIIRNIVNSNITKLDVGLFYKMCKDDMLSSVVRYPIQWVQDNFNKLDLYRTR